MVGEAGHGIRPFLHRIIRSRWGWWSGIVLLLALGAPRIARQVGTCFRPPADGVSEGLGDFRLLMGLIDNFAKTGVLYDTTGADPYGPVTVSMLKYPPPHAAFAMALVSSGDREAAHMRASLAARENMTREERQRFRRLRPYVRARPLFILYLASLLAALGVVLAALKPGWKLGGLITLVFLNWQPHWESIEGPGVESFLLLLFALSLAALKAGRASLGGVPIGLAGSLKVYPWGVVFPFLLSRRGLRVVLGVFLGTVLAFAASTYFVPPRISLEYLTRILPRVGGGSGLRDNVSVLGNFARLAYHLTGGPAPVTLPLGIRDLVRGFRPPPAALLALACWLAVSLPLAVLSIRALRRTAPGTPERHDLLGLGLSASLILLVMPTVWTAYQTILLIPLAVGFTLAPPPGGARLTWSLLLFAAGAGAVNIGLSPMPVVVLRSLLPLALWLACLRLLAREDPGRAPLASAEGPGPQDVDSPTDRVAELSPGDL
jgi:hypothetical protein